MNGMMCLPLLDSKARVGLGSKPCVTFSNWKSGNIEGSERKSRRSMWGSFATCGNSREMIQQCIGRILSEHWTSFAILAMFWSERALYWNAALKSYISALTLVWLL